MNSSQLDNIFLSYSKILMKFKNKNIKTYNGKEITYIDLIKAITVMQRKHSKCR